MPSLLLKLSGPLQSWGTQSRYRRRDAGREPSKSGVVGILAAALGRDRSEPVNDLATLRFAVRVDAPGHLVRDYQTAKDWRRPGSDANLSTRYYLADAVFVVALESDDSSFLEKLERALKNPAYPLYLGRRSCPAGYDLVLGIREEDMVSALRAEPWQAKEHHRRELPNPVYLPILYDGQEGDIGDLVYDIPVSFSQEHRQYGPRTVAAAEPVQLENPQGRKLMDTYNFMSTVEEA